MRKLAVLIAILAGLALLGVLQLFAAKADPYNFPAYAAFRSASGDAIVQSTGYASFSGAVFMGPGTAMSELKHGDMSFWAAPLRGKGAPVTFFVPSSVMDPGNGCNVYNVTAIPNVVTEPPTTYVRGIGAMPVQIYDFKAVEFYMAWKSAAPYCFLFGGPDRVAGTGCSTKVRVYRSDRSNWIVETLPNTNDTVLVADNPTKQAMGLRKMPFGLAINCPTCPCACGDNSCINASNPPAPCM